MTLAETTPFFGHTECKETVLPEKLQVTAREQQLVVGPLRVGAHLLLAELDQRLAKTLLAVG